MASTKRKNTEYLKEKVQELFGDDLSILTEYSNMATPVLVRCNKVDIHGEFHKKPIDLIHSKSGCPLCNPRKYDKRILTIKLQEFYGDKYELIMEGDSPIIIRPRKGVPATEVTLKCKEHGEFKTQARNITRGNIDLCSECRYAKSRNDVSTHLERINNIHGQDKLEFVIDQEYLGVMRKHKYKCLQNPDHGIFFSTPNNIEEGKGCKKCANNTMYTTEEFVALLKSKHNNEIGLLKGEVYQGAHHKLNFQCLKYQSHGVWSAKPNSILTGGGCPLCGRTKAIVSQYKNYGVSPEHEMTLYRILVFSDDECFFKVGITKHNIEIRFRHLFQNFGYKIYVLETLYGNLQEIVSLEQNFFIHTQLNQYSPSRRNKINKRKMSGSVYETFELPKKYEELQYFLMGSYEDMDEIFWEIPVHAQRLIE